jgi:hypothetical protein
MLTTSTVLIGSTAQEIELAAAETNRAVLIGQIELCIVGRPERFALTARLALYERATFQTIRPISVTQP